MNTHIRQMEKSVVTAGAYVWVGDISPFVIGPTPSGDRLAVVRLGGHREEGESAWQCAAREVREEASITIAAVNPPTTHWLSSLADPADVQPALWPSASDGDVPPFLVVESSDPAAESLSVMYLARANSQPIPAGEACGLLLLRQDDIRRIVEGGVTLDDYLSSGGRGLFRDPLRGSLALEPFLQLQVLAHLLSKHPGIVETTRAPQ